MGGIAAVIWTDVMNFAVLHVGALATVLVIVLSLEGGLSEMFQLAAEHDKLRVARLSWSWTGDALWVVVLGALFSNSLVPYTTDQAVIQRYLTTPTERQAARAIWLNVLVGVPASLLFFLLGTALFAFYHAHPAALRPLDSVDQILPWFVATQMPPGLSGLVIAGVFAASMSSLDSSMHSLSTAITTDFVRRFRAEGGDEGYLKWARGLTVLLGVLGTLAALWMAQVEVNYLWDLFLGILGLLGGTSAGLFLVGIFIPRVRPLHAWLGVTASIAALLAVKFSTDASGLLYGAIGVGACVLVAWTTSLILPAGGGDSNLTIFSLPREAQPMEAPLDGVGAIES
jgi:Na+/proline symporter